MNQPTVVTELEKTSLEAHVDLCALRYNQLDDRLGKLEIKVDTLSTKLDNFKAEIAVMMIKGGFTLIITLLGGVFGIMKYFR